MSRELIIRGGAVGDFVLTLPVFAALRHREPGGSIEILGYPAIAEMAVGRRHADAVRRVDAPEWAPLFSRNGRLGEAERAYLAGFDSVWCVWPDGDGVLAENLRNAGARNAVCVNPMPPESHDGHVTDFVARQCERAGLPVPYRDPQLFPSRSDHLWAESFMRVTGAGSKPLLGLHIGSGSPRKNWPLAAFVEVAAHWVTRRNGHVLLTVGPADEERHRAFREQAVQDGVFALRSESLPKVAACLSLCEAVMGNDSGILHMAAALSRPTLTLFGPTNPEVWRPRGPRSRFLIGKDGALEAIPPKQALLQLERLLRSA